MAAKIQEGENQSSFSTLSTDARCGYETRGSREFGQYPMISSGSMAARVVTCERGMADPVTDSQNGSTAGSATREPAGEAVTRSAGGMDEGISPPGGDGWDSAQPGA